VIIGLCSVVIRNFSIFNGGLMFAILIGNMFAPIIDYGVKARTAARAKPAVVSDKPEAANAKPEGTT
jgi:Na+-transporting NADH:ubiquinone oxidoreductase subunit B